MNAETYITRDHLTAFGMIINQFAQLDTIIEEGIRELLHLQTHQAALLMPELRHEQKRNFFLALVSTVNVSEERQSALAKLIKRVETKSRLRNHIAHSVWKKGRKQNTIKPMSISAKKTIKILGQHHNEKEYSAEELEAEATEISQIYQDIAAFIREGGDASQTEPEDS